MKKRNLFITLGLALTLGAGVAGGLSQRNFKLQVRHQQFILIYTTQTGLAKAKQVMFTTGEEMMPLHGLVSR